eukprot:238642-Amphidinium_carterae.1
MYNENRPVSYGSWLLAGLQLFYPQVIAHLQPSWQVQRQWNQLAPSETRTPLPVEDSASITARISPPAQASGDRTSKERAPDATI